MSLAPPLAARHAWRVAVAAGVVLGFVALAFHRDAHKVSTPLDERVLPLTPLAVPCRVAGREALAHAASLERLALARWERVPFALREAPHAAQQMAEAEACYAAANERVGRLRSASAGRMYGAEIERRFARASLLLRTSLARLETDRGGRARRAEQAQLQVATLLALLERAPKSAEPFRRELRRLALRDAAEVSERARPEEDER